MLITRRSRDIFRRSPLKELNPERKVLPTGKAWGRRSRHEIRTFFLLMKYLPQDIGLLVLSWVDWPTLGIIMELPPHGWWIQNMVGTLEQGLLMNILNNQYKLEMGVFVREQVPWTLAANGRRIWCDVPLIDYMIMLQDLRCLTKLIVSVWEIGLPRMNFRDEFQYWATHMWLFFGGPAQSANLDEETWRFFASLPRWKQVGLSEFFDKLVPVFLDEHPVMYPRRCMTHRNRCQWRTPPRLIEELEELGIIELLTKQLLMATMWCLMTTLNDFVSRLKVNIESTMKTYFAEHPNSNFWTRRNCFSHHPTLLNPTQRQIFFLDKHTYGIMVQGYKGQGLIHLMHVGPAANFLRQLDSALELPEGQALDLSAWRQQWPVGAPSYSIPRRRWWHWTEWREELYLDKLFE